MNEYCLLNYVDRLPIKQLKCGTQIFCDHSKNAERKGLSVFRGSDLNHNSV